MRITPSILTILPTLTLAACLGNHNSTIGSAVPPPPVVNSMAVTVDSGPAGNTGQFNHAYVTVKVCAPGSTTQCANIDHVLLDTGSWGLRLVRSVLTAAAVTLTGETDSQGQAIEECVTFGGGQTWGPVALADVTLAGEVAAKVPVQVMDDSVPTSSFCAAPLLNSVAGFGANGLLGVGVFAQDCGAACVSAATPLPVYFGCTSAGACTAENVALADQVTNPVSMFAADDNGIMIKMPNLANANGDASVAGELIFGIGTQTDNALPATGLTVLGADSSTGDFHATYSSSSYNSGATPLPALFDTGTDDYSFNDPTTGVCSLTSNPPSSGMWLGDYCPAPAPETVSVMNAGVGANNGTSTVTFAVADPNTFVAGAAAVGGLAGGGGATNFIYGMPFFYGRTIYVGMNGKMAGTYTGPFYAY